ncbi:hypothetical protein F0562_018845 [Nyssa sinensis]|uniref:Uncharacterized protein n=1 Tax=Nyssa sinensis TaxID=561372 RepID=A0A5J4ZCP7_9ASTE|nr:hypothetical protein F0562_018845 [Nyssa sinensis]
MNGGSSVSVDKLVGNNYSYWKLCMEAYLQGQDLWDLISSDDVVIPEDTPQNAELRKKWKIKCGKALFALRTSIKLDMEEPVTTSNPKLKGSPEAIQEAAIGANVAHETSEFEQLKWEQCLFIEAVDQPVILNSVIQQTNVETYANASIDYNKDWIIDSGCSHHATGNASLLSEVRPHYGKRAIVTADNSLHLVVKEGNFNVKKYIANAGGVSLKDVYHVPSLKKNLASVS